MRGLALMVIGLTSLAATAMAAQGQPAGSSSSNSLSGSAKTTAPAPGPTINPFTGKPVFAGTPGNAKCISKSVSALVSAYGGLASAASAQGYSGVPAMQTAIVKFCGG